MRFVIAGLTIVVFLLVLTDAKSDEKARREQAVRGDKSRFSSSERWMYEDLEAGFERARETGKPLLVALRCVPCKACTGLDEGILQSKNLQPLLDQFVCVRIINANDLDLLRFQFDYDLSFSTMFFHSDGTVYGRFGSWTHQLDEMDTAVDGFQATLERVLEFHREYPQNRDQFASKQGVEVPFQRPTQIPALAERYERKLNWTGNVVQSCVHCHQIGDAFREWHRSQGRTIPMELIYPMPDPKTIGIKVDPKRPWVIRSVDPESPASQGGLRAGDQIERWNGSGIASVADIAWELHRSDDPGTTKVDILRNQQAEVLTLKLPSGWRARTDISKRVGTWEMRAMVLGGMVLQEISASKRRELQLDDAALGLEVRHVGEYGKHEAAKKAGFVKGDIVISIEGVEGPQSESSLIGTLLQRSQVPSQLSTHILRGKERITLALPIQ